MLPDRVPPPRDDKTARAHLRANIQAAATGDKHPGHWHMHFAALPDGLSGDFTPCRPAEYAEEELAPGGAFFEWLAELLGPDHGRAIAERGLEAGQ